MKLFHVSQSENNNYDSFSDFVVCCETEDEARNIHPGYGDQTWNNDMYNLWCKSPEDVTVTYIGEAAAHLKKGIICSSFHAG
jgi:hypothetical protein